MKICEVQLFKENLSVALPTQQGGSPCGKQIFVSICGTEKETSSALVVSCCLCCCVLCFVVLYFVCFVVLCYCALLLCCLCCAIQCCFVLCYLLFVLCCVVQCSFVLCCALHLYSSSETWFQGQRSFHLRHEQHSINWILLNVFVCIVLCCITLFYIVCLYCLDTLSCYVVQCCFVCIIRTRANNSFNSIPNLYHFRKPATIKC